MTRCDWCKWKYPEYLVAEFETNMMDTKSMICGICYGEYLAKEFESDIIGEIAILMREVAKDWRASNPEMKPK